MQAIEHRIAPSGSQREAIRKLLDKVIAEAVLALPLKKAQELPQTVRSDLAIVLQDYLGPKELAKLASSWEPKRKLDASQKPTLKRDLVDLLRGDRAPYDGIAPLTLSEARSRSHDPTLRKSIERIAPAKDLKAILKKWDKHFKPIPSDRNLIAGRLLSLLGGQEPARPI